MPRAGKAGRAKLVNSVFPVQVPGSRPTISPSMATRIAHQRPDESVTVRSLDYGAIHEISLHIGSRRTFAPTEGGKGISICVLQ